MKLWRITVGSDTYLVMAGSVTSAISKVIREHNPDFESGNICIELASEGILVGK